MSDATAPKKEQAASAPVPKDEEKQPAAPVGDVPDPDEDDLDDLDDMLDDFSKPKPSQSKPTEPVTPSPAAAASAAPSSSTAAAAGGPSLDDKSLEDLLGDEDFAKQLQAGMADLLGELDKNPEMQKEFDNMFKSMSAAAEEAAGVDVAATAASAKPAGQPSTSSTGAGAAAGATDASFQDTIRRTMERMQASGDQATAAAAESSTEDLLAEMMKQLGQGGGAGLGDGSEEDFSKMLMGMMEQLTNKEILHEPMKELHEKFPEWLEKNKATAPADDVKRYEEQQVLVREIVAKFDEPTYSDSNAADREYIVARMQKMQDLGSPPPDLVGDMPSAQDAFGAPDLESCNPQ